MWTRLGEFDSAFSVFDELRQRFDRVWDEYDRPERDGQRARAISWPRVNVFDEGAAFVVEADVPGMTQKDLRLTVNESTVTFEGSRKSDAPQGYSIHRQERGAYEFSRSFSLPFKADADKCTAIVKDGVLTVTIAKAKESQPRQIEVRAS
jgi:HSP20 family protein